MMLYALVLAAIPPTVRLNDGSHLPMVSLGGGYNDTATAATIVAAVAAGFRGIDTACQPKHYHEAGVGDALVQLQAEGVERDSLWIQTKFTPLAGQDPANCPYEKFTSLENQVAESVATSLRNLRVECVDCLLLHSPLPTHRDTVRVWRAMEKAVAAGRAKTLGVCNMYDPTAFRRLHEDAAVKPSVLQNRFYAQSGYDAELRQMCEARGVRYQSFWTLTANKDALGSRAVGGAAAAHGVTPEQAWFAYMRALGITPLSGTTSEAHMRDDLAAASLQLSPAETRGMARLLRPPGTGWL